ncbi:PA-phosphatase [Bradyrhizobium sp. CCBAU 51753]|nr:PA-phosphatase [Bradyrhizobium sp. CCBAU 51753]
MADAYANSIMVDALIQSREGTIVPEFNTYAPGLPSIEDAAQLERWEPWVRAYTAIGEMLQGISFAPTTTGNGFQVQSSQSAASSTTASPFVIAAIERPNQATFVAQLPIVLSWAELRDERATEIMAQIDPQYAFWSSIIYMHPDRTKRTFELINIVLQFCVYVEMRFKHALACWRPVEYNAEVQPMITTPGHGSFPSGHSTQAHAVAYMLKQLLFLDRGGTTGYDKIKDQLDRQAARIAVNRTVAGVHFPVDSMAGRMLGVALGEYFVGRCLGTTTRSGSTASTIRTFNATWIDHHASTDFNPFSSDQDLGAGKLYSTSTGVNIQQSLLMQHLWAAAQAEWQTRFPYP